MKLANILSRGLRKIAARFEAAEGSTARGRIFSAVQSPTRDATPATRRNLTSASRELYNNYSLFCAIIERLVSLTVGGGFTVTPTTSSAEFNNAAARAWKDFADECELTSRRNFLTFQKIFARSVFVDGDVFTVHTFDEFGNPKWQIFEGYRITDKISCDWDKPEGVVLDSFGRPVAYNIALDEDFTRFARVPASAVVRYSFDKRPNQYRGLPLMHAAINTILDTKEIIGYEKQSVKASSAFIGSVSRESGEESTEGAGFAALKNLGTPPDTSETDEAVLQWYQQQTSSGFKIGRPGDKIEMNSTDRPGPAWQGFMSFLVESACLATGLTPSVILGTKVGGADTRAVLAMAERVVGTWQNDLTDAFQLEYEWVIEDAIFRGKLPDAPQDWFSAKWNRPARLTVDAGRLAAQEREDVKAGLLTREEHYAARGLDYRRELRQAAAEARYIMELSQEFGVPPEMIDAAFTNPRGLDSFGGGFGGSENSEFKTAARIALGHHSVSASTNGLQPAYARQNANPASSLANLSCSPSVEPQSQSKKDSNSARCPRGECTHKWAKGGCQKKTPDDGGKKKKYGALAEKLVKSSEAFRRIDNPKGETITASDGKIAIFNSQSIKHVVGDHTEKDGRKRMEELYFAMDTTATGISFESLNKGKKQTEFIKEYDTGTGRKKFFYTARRGKSNIIYSWHEISGRRFLNKKKEAAK